MLFRSKLDRLITFLGVAGFAVGIFLSQAVFPSAAIDLSVPRQRIFQQAESYLQDINTLDMAEYESVQRFGESWFSSVYLQRTLGIAETSELIERENLPIYSWNMRWFQPSVQEEFDLSLSTTGDVVGYTHTIPESEPGANLEEDAARAIARTYLENDRGWKLANWEPVDASTTKQPKRTDHTFDWKRKDFDYGEAELRLTVGIHGDEVGYYDYWVKVPEAFSRSFREERSQASFFSNIFYLIGFYGPLSVAFLFFVFAIARNRLDWRTGLWPAAAFFTVSLLAQLNTLPLDKGYYSTTQNYTFFWIQQVYFGLFNAISFAVPIYFLWLGGKQIAKRVWPQQDMILPRSPNRLQVFTQAYWRGLMMGGIGTGYVVLFYLVTTRVFGTWSPMDVNYSDILSTPLPFLSPLRTGILPAMSEELGARLVSLGVLIWLFRSRWLALVVAGGIWAFAHLGYVSDPIYLRGIELWIPAVFLYGWFFLRFGLLTTMVGHCVYNARFGAELLLNANDAYLVASGALIVALLIAPLLPGLVQRWLNPEKMSAKASLQVRAASVDDYTLVRRLPLANLVSNNKLEEIFGIDSQRFSSVKLALSQESLALDYEVVCLVSDGVQAEKMIEGVAIAQITSPQSAVVQVVYVSPRYRRCYYGTKLVQVLVQRLQQRNVRDIETEAGMGNRRSTLFWANQKWSVISQKFRNKQYTTSP